MRSTLFCLVLICSTGCLGQAPPGAPDASDWAVAYVERGTYFTRGAPTRYRVNLFSGAQYAEIPVGPVVDPYARDSSVVAAAIHPNGQLAILTDDGAIEVFSLLQPDVEQSSAAFEAIALGWSNDGEQLAVLVDVSPPVLQLRSRSLELLSETTLDSAALYQRFSTLISWSADDARVAISCDYNCGDRPALIIELETGVERSVVLTNMRFIADHDVVADGPGWPNRFRISGAQPVVLGPPIRAHDVVASSPASGVFLATALLPSGVLIGVAEGVVGNMNGTNTAQPVGGLHPDRSRNILLPRETATETLRANGIEWMTYGAAPE